MSKNPFPLGSPKLAVVRSALLTGARGKVFIENTWKQRKEIIELAIAYAVALFGKI